MVKNPYFWFQFPTRVRFNMFNVCAILGQVPMSKTSPNPKAWDWKGGLVECFPKNVGTPIAEWFIYVYFMENPKLKWMITGEKKYFRKPPHVEKSTRL